MYSFTIFFKEIVGMHGCCRQNGTSYIFIVNVNFNKGNQGHFQWMKSGCPKIIT